MKKFIRWTSASSCASRTGWIIAHHAADVVRSPETSSETAGFTLTQIGKGGRCRGEADPVASAGRFPARRTRLRDRQGPPARPLLQNR